MGKDNKGNEIGKNLRQRPDGRYEARAKIKGVDINLYNTSLTALKKEFKEAKDNALIGIQPTRKNITLNEWFEEWFEIYKVPYVKPTSVFPMKSKFKNTFGRIIGDKKLTDITNIDIQKVINQLQSEERASSSMRDALGRTRDCMESAKINRLILNNPCFDIKVPWENTTVERRFLSQEEQNIFLTEVESNWYKEMYYIMFLTGMRIGEVGGLRWVDVDFKNKCININQSLSCQYEAGVKTLRITDPKTHNSKRKIPFMGEAEEMFLSQKKKYDRLKKQLGKRWRGKGEFDNLVFCTTMGSPVLRYHAEKDINNIVNAINLNENFNSVKEGREPAIFEHMYPHAIRHTFCSRCFQRNMNPKVVQGLMGHQHYSTTIEIYTHVMEEQINDEINKFGSAVSNTLDIDDNIEKVS
jgi:integrase